MGSATRSHEGIAVTVTGVEYHQSVNDFGEASDGMEFAILDITTANDSDEVSPSRRSLRSWEKTGLVFRSASA
jgi:hypothetical protein